MEVEQAHTTLILEIDHKKIQDYVKDIDQLVNHVLRVTFENVPEPSEDLNGEETSTQCLEGLNMNRRTRKAFARCPDPLEAEDLDRLTSGTVPLHTSDVEGYPGGERGGARTR